MPRACARWLTRICAAGGAASTGFCCPPRAALRAPLFEAVNDSIRLLAGEVGASMRVIPNETVISPGGFKQTITYDGLHIHPRTPDGIHITHEGACVERNLIVEAMRADGLLTPAPS